MKISERTVKRLGEIITGDKGLSHYRGGPKLVSFFNEFGTNHTYGQGFPSRWMFTEECIRSKGPGRPLATVLKISPIFFARLWLEFGLRLDVSEHPCSPTFRPTTQAREP